VRQYGGGKAVLIVTGDRAMLELKIVESTEIVTLQAFLNRPSGTVLS